MNKKSMKKSNLKSRKQKGRSMFLEKYQLTPISKGSILESKYDVKIEKTNVLFFGEFQSLKQKLLVIVTNKMFVVMNINKDGKVDKENPKKFFLLDLIYSRINNNNTLIFEFQGNNKTEIFLEEIDKFCEEKKETIEENLKYITECSIKKYYELTLYELEKFVKILKQEREELFRSSTKNKDIKLGKDKEKIIIEKDKKEARNAINLAEDSEAARNAIDLAQDAEEARNAIEDAKYNEI